jgi:hypothetical protein
VREGPRSVAARDLQRAGVAVRRFGRGLVSDVAPGALPLFIIGAQRSGTEVLVEALRKSPLVKVYNEHQNSVAFRAFSLRSDDVVRNLVVKSRCRCVAFKALNDSHRIVHLLEHLGTPAHGRAIWIYRSVEARVRSAVARFGDDELRILRRIADGSLIGWERYLSEKKVELVHSFDYDDMTPESAAALYWYLRNSLFFELDLGQREDVLLASYEAIVAEPAHALKDICAFLGVPCSARLHDHIAPRPMPIERPLEIDGQLGRLCAELYERLEAERRARGLLPSVADLGGS